MWFQFRAIKRLTSSHFLALKYLWKPKSHLSKFHCSQNSKPEQAKNADMGKEKLQYQLKTPKGTKDCEVSFQ